MLTHSIPAVGVLIVASVEAEVEQGLRRRPLQEDLLSLRGELDDLEWALLGLVMPQLLHVVILAHEVRQVKALHALSLELQEEWIVLYDRLSRS